MCILVCLLVLMNLQVSFGLRGLSIYESWTSSPKHQSDWLWILLGLPFASSNVHMENAELLATLMDMGTRTVTVSKTCYKGYLKVDNNIRDMIRQDSDWLKLFWSFKKSNMLIVLCEYRRGLTTTLSLIERLWEFLWTFIDLLIWHYK